MSDEEVRRAGRAVRTELQGESFMSLQRHDDDPLWRSFQEAVNYLYGSTWSWPTLSRRERCLITVAVLAALNRPVELDRHVGAARRNGLGADDLGKAAFHLSLYGGLPAAVDLWRVIDKTFEEACGERVGTQGGLGGEAVGGASGGRNGEQPWYRISHRPTPRARGCMRHYSQSKCIPNRSALEVAGARGAPPPPNEAVVRCCRGGVRALSDRATPHAWKGGNRCQH